MISSALLPQLCEFPLHLHRENVRRCYKCNLIVILYFDVVESTQKHDYGLTLACVDLTNRRIIVEADVSSYVYLVYIPFEQIWINALVEYFRFNQPVDNVKGLLECIFEKVTHIVHLRFNPLFNLSFVDVFLCLHAGVHDINQLAKIIVQLF